MHWQFKTTATLGIMVLTDAPPAWAKHPQDQTPAKEFAVGLRSPQFEGLLLPVLVQDLADLVGEFTD